MAKEKVITLGEDRFNADWLRSVTEQEAIKKLTPNHPKSRVINAHKQANGKTVRNYKKSDDDAEKKPAKKATKKSDKDKK